MRNPPRHIAVICGLASTLLWSGGLLAAERLTVEQLQKYHVSYHLRSVRLVGRVQTMHLWPPIQKAPSRNAPCNLLYGVSQFELTDDTGTIPVETEGSCSPAAMEPPQNGDVIQLTAKVFAFVPAGKTERVIKAVAERIVVLPPTH